MDRKIADVRTGKRGVYLNLYPESDYDPTEYERPTLTADVAIFRLNPEVGCTDRLQVLLIRRAQEPFTGMLAFPGGYVNIRDRESILDAAHRELHEEAGIQPNSVELHQFKTYATADRDPRWYTTTVLHYCLLHESQWRGLTIEAGDDAASAAWVTVSEAVAGEMAFDHKQALVEVAHHLRDRVWDASVLRALGAGPSGRFVYRDLLETYNSIRRDAPLTLTNFIKMLRSRFRYEPTGVKAHSWSNTYRKVSEYIFLS